MHEAHRQRHNEREPAVLGQLVTTNAAVEGWSRRTFIRDLGKGVLGISVGAVLVSACGSDEGSSNEPTTTAGSSTTTAPPDTQSTTSATEAPGTTGATTTSEETTASAGLDVQRVDLGFVSAYVLVRGTEAAIVDTGSGGSAPAIEQGLAEAGLGWGDVGNVILTHRHGDHIGSLGEVADLAAAAVLGTGPEEVAATAAPRAVDGYEDGATVFGLQIVATPGHTPGHIAVFDGGTGILVAGDAITGDGAGAPTIVDGVGGPNPSFTPDMDLAIRSVAKMAALQPDSIYFGHGPPKIGGAAAALTELAASL